MLFELSRVDLGALPAPEIIIVGGGAVGLTMAAELARKQRRVLLLEAGTKRVSRESQALMEGASWEGFPLVGLHSGRFRVLGGGTNFWGGQLVPMDQAVFLDRPWREETAWPIAPEEIQAYYRRAFELIGMRQQLEDPEVWKRLGITPPASSSNIDLIFTRWAPEPNFAQLFAEDIEKSPNLTVLLDAQVTAFEMENDRVVGARTKSLSGREATFRAPFVVLANGTVEIARLLMLPLASGQPAPWSGNPWLGKGFLDHVDCDAGSAYPIDKERFHEIFDNAYIDGVKYSPKLKLACDAQMKHELGSIAGHFLFNSSLSEHLAFAKSFVKSLMRGRFDVDLKSLPREALFILRFSLPLVLRYIFYRRMYNPADLGIQLRLTSEQRALMSSAITLSEERDCLGVPQVKVVWKVEEAEIATLSRFALMLAEYIEGAGLARIELDPRLAAGDPAFLQGIDDANHQMGGARMAGDAAGGVVDANLRVFGAQNLFVAGAAVYPSSGFPNPTFTAIALGLRVCDSIVDALQNDRTPESKAESRVEPLARRHPKIAGVETTPLGFGCAYLTAGWEQRKSSRLIHAALEGGIRHFDVAPSYGMGSAEDALGAALVGRRSEVTIASKAGLARPQVKSYVMAARALAAPIRRALPMITRGVGSKVVQGARRQFGLPVIEASLTESLRRLRTDYLDLFFLHQAEPEDVTDEVLRFLDDLRSKGLVRWIGVASDRSACETIAVAHPGFFDAFQYSWSILNHDCPPFGGARLTLTHRALLNALQPVGEWLSQRPDACQRLSEAAQMDLSAERNLADVLLSCALLANEDGIVLASSRKTQRVRRLGEVMENQSLKNSARAFLAAFPQEAGTYFGSEARPA
nr:aldo/keto reductase [Methylocystis heyeri]